MGDEISTDLGQVSDCDMTELINEYADENNVTQCRLFDDAKIIKELENWKPYRVFPEVENRVRNEHLTIGCAAKNVPIIP